jgi:hypothetical protein
MGIPQDCLSCLWLETWNVLQELYSLTDLSLLDLLKAACKIGQSQSCKVYWLLHSLYSLASWHFLHQGVLAKTFAFVDSINLFIINAVHPLVCLVLDLELMGWNLLVKPCIQVFDHELFWVFIDLLWTFFYLLNYIFRDVFCPKKGRLFWIGKLWLDW